MKEYLIPHNYDNNGRLFNLFYKEDFAKGLIFGLPLAILIYNLPLSFQNKLSAMIIVVLPIELIFLLGFGNWLIYLLSWQKNKKVYYRVKAGDLKNEKFYYKFYTKPKEKTTADQ